MGRGEVAIPGVLRVQRTITITRTVGFSTVYPRLLDSCRATSEGWLPRAPREPNRVRLVQATSRRGRDVRVPTFIVLMARGQLLKGTMGAQIVCIWVGHICMCARYGLG